MRRRSKSKHGTAQLKTQHVGNMPPATIDASMSPAGAISLKYDTAAMTPHIGMSKAQAAAAAANSQAAMLQFQLGPFNRNDR
jgi:hypothetical protein